MITQILEMIFAEPLVPYVELYLICILIKYFMDKFEIFNRENIKEDIKKLKEILNESKIQG